MQAESVLTIEATPTGAVSSVPIATLASTMAATVQNPVGIESSNMVPSIPERTPKEEAADRMEAELDEMSRWVGPVAKSLFPPVAAPLVDANSFADALGVSPLYKQKESQRWSSALHIYRQMSSSSQDQNAAGQLQLGRLSEDEELAGLVRVPSPMNGDAVSGSLDENVVAPSARPSAPPPREMLAAPIAVPANSRPQHRPSAGLAPLQPTGKGGLHSPTIAPSFTPRRGFMTPPAIVPWSVHPMPANYIVSPPNRKSSTVSPGEASLNSLELEAIAAVHELQFAVKDIYVSEMLPRTSELIFLNLTTLEGQAYCVELTMKGWRVTSLRHDCMNGDIHHLDLHIQYFETIYALMDRISPGYRQRFADALMVKLSAIEAERRAADYALEKCQKNDDSSPEERLEQERRQTFT